MGRAARSKHCQPIGEYGISKLSAVSHNVPCIFTFLSKLNLQLRYLELFLHEVDVILSESGI
jgi:hypothetical protein